MSIDKARHAMRDIFSPPEIERIEALIDAKLAPAPADMRKPEDGGTAREKLNLWFFRDIVDQDRHNLFALFGLPLDEMKSLGTQRKALDHILGLLRDATIADRDRRIAAERVLTVHGGQVESDGTRTALIEWPADWPLVVNGKISALLSVQQDTGGSDA